MNHCIRISSLLVAGAALLLSACEQPPVQSTQTGYRGTSMIDLKHPATVKKLKAANAIPDVVPAAPADGPRANEVFQNIQVLGDLSAAEMSRLMVAMTNWVAPKEGCTYCHAADNMATDTYRKVVARRMIQMTRHVNTDWKAHVGQTGVTCYTCHRGNGIPQNIWFNDPAPQKFGWAGNDAGQNRPAKSVGRTSLPYDPFSKYLAGDASGIRVESTTALPSGNKTTIKQTEATYALMVHMSESLGVNCTYCHNSRQFASWEESRPPRGTAWYGLRMAGQLNKDYLTPLTSTFPKERLGPHEDVAKINCQTCHQGVNKPLYGVSMAKDYPEIQGIRAMPAVAAAANAGAVVGGAAAGSVGAAAAAVDAAASAVSGDR